MPPYVQITATNGRYGGPHNRGVTLCEKHQDMLSTTGPADKLSKSHY